MLRYKRKAAELENEKTALVNEAQNIENHTAELNRWKDLHDRALLSAEKTAAQYESLMKRKDERLIARDKEIVELKAELARKDEKIESFYDTHSSDREIIDNLRSENTALIIFRCDEVGCSKRKPPLAYQIPALALTETLKAQHNPE